MRSSVPAKWRASSQGDVGLAGAGRAVEDDLAFVKEKALDGAKVVGVPEEAGGEGFEGL